MANKHEAEMGSWASLPPEIRNEILLLVLETSPKIAGNFEAKPHLTRYILVSREWQAFFEPDNLKSLFF